LTKDKRSLSAAPIVIQYQRASVDLLNAQLSTVWVNCGNLAKFSSSTAIGGEAAMISARNHDFKRPSPTKSSRLQV